MFTGIVESTGIIHSISETNDCKEFILQPYKYFDDLCVGDSLAVNGVCLTLTHVDIAQQLFSVTAVPETLRVTNLGKLIAKSEVNLERSLQVGTRIGGHFVQGHIDTTAKILKITPDGDNAWIVTFALKPEFSRYLVNKGFITIDGMSITLIEALENCFTVTFIPHTIHETIVKHYHENDDVNIEIDMTAKMLEKFVSQFMNDNRLLAPK